MAAASSRTIAAALGREAGASVQHATTTLRSTGVTCTRARLLLRETLFVWSAKFDASFHESARRYMRADRNSLVEYLGGLAREQVETQLHPPPFFPGHDEEDENELKLRLQEERDHRRRARR